MDAQIGASRVFGRRKLQIRTIGRADGLRVHVRAAGANERGSCEEIRRLGSRIGRSRNIIGSVVRVELPGGHGVV